jgi:hypothetical protein
VLAKDYTDFGWNNMPFSKLNQDISLSFNMLFDNLYAVSNLKTQLKITEFIPIRYVTGNYKSVLMSVIRVLQLVACDSNIALLNRCSVGRA